MLYKYVCCIFPFFQLHCATTEKYRKTKLHPFLRAGHILSYPAIDGYRCMQAHDMWLLELKGFTEERGKNNICLRIRSVGTFPEGVVHVMALLLVIQPAGVSLLPFPRLRLSPKDMEYYLLQ